MKPEAEIRAKLVAASAAIVATWDAVNDGATGTPLAAYITDRLASAGGELCDATAALILGGVPSGQITRSELSDAVKEIIIGLAAERRATPPIFVFERGTCTIKPGARFSKLLSGLRAKCRSRGISEYQIRLLGLPSFAPGDLARLQRQIRKIVQRRAASPARLQSWVPAGSPSASPRRAGCTRRTPAQPRPDLREASSAPSPQPSKLKSATDRGVRKARHSCRNAAAPDTAPQSAIRDPQSGGSSS